MKCVRWRDGNTLASCGNDGTARLWDARCPNSSGGAAASPSLEIAEATVGGVAANVIRWRGGGCDETGEEEASAGKGHHLLVAGTNPEALVFDVRRPSGPMLSLKPPPQPQCGKGRSSSSSSSVIYQPCYVGLHRGRRRQGGSLGSHRQASIAVGLPRSRVVSLFCADTGAPLSRGDVGDHDASTLQSFGVGGGGTEVVCAVGTRCLHLFEAF